MGFNICLYDSDGNEHPTWDFIRMGGDRDFLNLIDFKNVSKVPDGYKVHGRDEMFKPNDIDRIRQDLHKLDGFDNDYERWDNLLDILGNDNYYMYISY